MQKCSLNHYGLLTNGLDTASVPKLLMETRLGFLHEHVTFHNIKLFTDITGLKSLCKLAYRGGKAWVSTCKGYDLMIRAGKLQY